MKTWVKRGLIGVAVVLVGSQAVPYGHDHSNPPVISEPAWNSPETRALAVRACFDCHSNESKWPWYSNVAPVSWLVQNDVNDGRRHLNFSEWNRAWRHAKDAATEVKESEMPPAIYLPMHAEAVLTAAEKQKLADGFTAMFGAPEPESKP